MGRIGSFEAGALVLCLGTTMASAQDLVFAIDDGPFDWESFKAFAAETDFAGETLTVTGPGTGDDGDRLRNLYAYFEVATGAAVNYSGSDSFEQDIVISTQAGSPPNVASFPQPGLARDLARQGFLAPMDDIADWVSETYAAGPSWVDLATFEGPDGADHLYGLFYGVDVKSLVWYAPDAFDEAGYDIPESMEDLRALTEQIVADGGTPWCIGLGSGAATGWPATDWVEDLMLRTQPPEVYDDWVTNDVRFDDPRVIAAIEEFGWFAKTEAFVNGGVQAVSGTDFRDSPAGLFTIPNECYMHRQASFIPNFFPDGVEMGNDVDFFYFPAYADADLGRPVLGAGGLTAITRDAPVARAFIEFLKLPVAHEIFMAQGNFLTPHLGVNPEAYANDTQRALGEILAEATTFRFDGSDLMPGEVGTDAFWSAMVGYVSGAEAADVVQGVQDRWDAIQ
ncbi:MAG: ABC transporter substrate-binding protein [Pseudomonadota bacterium]